MNAPTPDTQQSAGAPRRARLDYRRVQRPTGQLPVLHLEKEVPLPERMYLQVGGLVEVPGMWEAAEIHSMPIEERCWDLHCVWGWTRPACVWGGVPASRLIDECRPRPSARYAVVTAFESPYASCLTLEEARESVIAWRLDGADLTPEHGWPMRLVPPARKWGYKGVKWAASIELVERFSPGFWEDLVGNPHGDVPVEMLEMELE